MSSARAKRQRWQRSQASRPKQRAIRSTRSTASLNTSSSRRSAERSRRRRNRCCWWPRGCLAARSSCRKAPTERPRDGSSSSTRSTARAALMYQKRPAWILTGVARGPGPCTLADIELAVQTEIPLVKQHLSDELWAVRGQGASAVRVNRFTGEIVPLILHPSTATTLAHGFAMISRFFPGNRAELAAIDDEVVAAVMGLHSRARHSCSRTNTSRAVASSTS